MSGSPPRPLLALGLLTACTPNLSGEWSGEVECDLASMELSFSLEERGRGYEGTGTIQDYGCTCTAQACDDAAPFSCDISMKVNVGALDRMFPGIERELEMSITECQWKDGNLLVYQPCVVLEHAEWDGESISAEVSDPEGTEIERWDDCPMEVGQ